MGIEINNSFCLHFETIFKTLHKIMKLAVHQLLVILSALISYSSSTCLNCIYYASVASNERLNRDAYAVWSDALSVNIYKRNSVIIGLNNLRRSEQTTFVRWATHDLEKKSVRLKLENQYLLAVEPRRIF